jgi:hypothetical protein
MRHKISRLFPALLVVASLALPAAAQVTRHYCIQAEDVIWDFAPSDRDLAHSGGRYQRLGQRVMSSLRCATSSIATAAFLSASRTHNV